MTKFVGIRAKTYSYLIDDDSEDKKAKGTKKCHKNKTFINFYFKITFILKFYNYKNCLESTQLENKINYLEKNKTDIDSIKENHQEFLKNNKSILKILQRFKKKGTMFSLKKLIRLF